MSRLRLVLALGLTAVALGAAAALAYFSVAGSGAASAGIGTLSAPTISTPTPGPGTVALSWSTVSAPASGTVSYFVSRDGGAAGGDCPTSGSPTTATSCTDSGLGVGTYSYTVTAVWRSWTATSAPATAVVTQAITLSPTSGHVGDTVTISGTLFHANKSVSATYDGASVNLSPATTTDGSGAFSGATFVVPASTAGAHTVEVSVDGQVADATFTVTPKITLSVSSGNVGDSVTVSGTGFAASSALTLKYRGVVQTTTPPSPATDATGSFSGVSFTVTASAKGNHTVSATDASAGNATATFTVVPKLTLSPSTGNVGDTVTMSGTGFAASSSTTVTYDGAAQATSPASPTTDSNGSFSASFTVPSSVVGSHTVAASDGAANGASTAYTVTPKITLSPSSGHVGDTVTITGSGFGGSLTLGATYAGSGIALTPLTPTTSSTGGFSATFVVPVGTAGARTLAVTDSFANNASASFTVTPQVVLSGGSVSATSGYVGDTITVTGTGFAGSDTIPTHTYGGSTVALTPTTPTTTGSGGFSATFTAPASTAGAHTASFTDSSSNSASTSFTVNPQVTLSPTTGAAGSTDSIAGTGFAGASALSATFNTGTSLTLGGTTSTDANGSFSGATYTVPTIGSGIYAVRATDGSSNSATASFALSGSVTSRATANWNVATTWTGSVRSGTITTSNSSTAVTGSGTRFTTELQAGDALYKSDGTTLIGTVVSVASDTSLTLNANAASTNNGIAYAAGRVPTAQDDVTIAGGFLVTIPSGAAAVARFVTVTPLANSAELALAASSSSLTVGGAFLLNRPTSANNAVLNVGPGTVTLAGNLSYVGTVTTSSRCVGVIVTTGTLNVGGDLTMDNQGTANACVTKAPVPSADTPLAMDDLDLGGGAATFNLAGAITLSSPANASASLESTTSSVFNFNGTSSQTITVPGSPNWDYGDITVSNTSAGGATLGGALSSANFTSDLTITAGATLNASTFTHSLVGNFTNNGTFNANTSTITFAGSGAQTLAGSSTTTFANLAVSSTGTVTLGTSASVSGDLTVSGGTFDLGSNTVNRTSTGGTLTVGASGTLKIGGTNGFPSSYATHSLNAASKVNYSGSSQIVSNESYGNLSLSGSGTKTPAAGLSVAGTMTVGSGVTFAAGSLTHSVGGDFVNNGAFNAGTSTLTLNGSGAQSIGGAATTAFNNVTVSKSGGTATLAANESVSNNLSVAQGTLDVSTFTLNGSGGGTFSVSGGATLNVGGSSNFPTAYGTTSLATSGTVNYNAAGAQTISTQTYGNLTTSGTGTKTPAAGLTVNGNLTIGTGTTFAASSFTHSFAGNFTNNGTFSSGGTATFNGSGAQTIGGSSTTSFNALTVNNIGGAVTLANAESAVNLTVSTGTLDLSTFALTGTGTGTLTVGSGATLELGGTNGFPASFPTHTLDAASTVVYNGTTQSVSGETYGSLTISGTGTATLTAAGTVAGDLTVSSGTLALTTFTLGRASSGGTLTVASDATLTIGGTNSFPANYVTHSLDAASTVVYSGTTQTVSSEAYGNLQTSGTATLSANVSIAGNLTVSGGTLDLQGFTANRTAPGGTLSVAASGTLKLGGASGFPANFTTHTLNASSTVNYNGTSQSVSGESYGNLTISLSGTGALAAAGTVAGNLTVSTGTLDLGTYTLNGGGTSTLAVSGGATLAVGGASNFPASYLTTSLAATSTVNYNGAAQTINSQNYGNLTLSGSNTKTAAAGLVVAGTTTIASGATFSAGTLTHSLGGNFTNNGTFTAGTSTVILNGSGAQSIGGSSTTAFNNITVNKGSGTATLAANATVTNNLSVSAGTLDLATFTLNGSGAGTFTVASGSTVLVGGASNFPASYGTTSLAASSTVNYNAAGPQSVSSQTYGNLTTAGSGTKTAAAGLTVNGDVTIVSGTTFAASSFSHSLAGNFTDNGGFSSSGTVTFNGAGAQAIGGLSSTVFNNLTVSSGATVSLGANQSVAGNLTVSAGTLDLSSFTLDRASMGGSLTVAAGATLKIGGSWTFPANYSTHSLDSASTVNYTGVAQLISNESYGNLALSGSGALTMPAGALAVAGTFTSSGTVSATLLAGLTVSGDVTVGSGTTVTTGSFADSFAGNFTNNGTFIATGSTVALNGTGAEAISGSTTTSFTNLTVSNGTTAVTAATNFNVSGTFTVGAGAVFTPAAAVVVNNGGAAGTITGSGTVQVTRTTVTADYSSQYEFTTNTLTNLTVEYSAASAQTISAVTYGNLKTSGAATKTAAAGLTVTGDVTVVAGSTFAASTFNHSFAGNFTNNGTFTTTGTLTLNGSGAQAIGGSTTTSLTNLTVSNATTAVTASTSFNVSGTFMVGAGAVFIPAAAVVVNSGAAAGTITGSGTVQVTRTAATADYSSQFKFTTNTLASLTVEYSASAAQTISAVTYGNLKTSGSGTKTAAAGLTVNGDVTIGSGSTFAASSFSHSFAGNFTNNGTFTSSGTITLNGAGAEAIGGSSTTTFSSLTVSNSAVAPSVSFNVSGTLTISAGVIFTPGASVQINSGGAQGTITGSGTAQVTRTAATADFSSQYAFSTNTLTSLTVDYSASAAQTISAVIYGNLKTSGSGTKTAAGAVTVGGNVIIGSSTALDPAGNTISVGGNWTNNGSFVTGATVTFNGSGAQTIGGSSTPFNNLTVSSGGTVSLGVGESVAGNLSVTAGTLDLSTFVVDRASTGGSLTVSAGATLKIGGSSKTFPANYSTHSLDPASTVNYTGATPTVTNESYGNLTLSGSGTVTMPSGALSVAGAFATSGTVSATLQAALTVGSDATVGSGTTVVTGAFTDSFAGNFTNNGTFTATGSTVVLNGTGAHAIAGSTTTSFASLTLSNSSAFVTASTNFNVSGTFTVSSGAIFTPAAALVVNTGGAAGTITGSGTVQVTRTAVTADYSSQYKFTTNTLTNLTVEYSAAAAQTVSALTYGSLKTSGSGIKTVAGTLTVGGDLTIGSGTTFNTGGAFTASVGGNFTNNGTFTNANASSALTFNGTGAQAIGGSGTGNLNIVTINKSSGTATLAANETIGSGAGFTGTLTVTAGTLDLATFTFNRSATGGILTVSAGATLRLGAGSGGQTGSNFPTNFTTVSLASTSIVEYSATGSAQTIYATPPYGNLLVSGTTTKTAGAGLTVAGGLTIASGSTFAPSTFTHAVTGAFSNSGTFSGGSGTVNIAGSFINSGTFTASTGTIGFNGSSNQTVTGATTFNNLTVANSAGITLANSETVNTTLTLTSGAVTTGANSMIVAAGGAVSRTGGLIVGFEQRNFNTGSQSATFDVGTVSTYTPVSVASMNVTTQGSLTASATASQQPNYATSGLSVSQYVNRYWTLTAGGGLVVSAYNATGTFVAGDLVGSPTTANLALYRYTGGAWTAPTSWSATATTATGTAFGTAFGDFASGIPPATQLLFTTTPSGASAGTTFATQPQVTVADAMGHAVTSDSSTVTLSITGGTPTSGGPGTLSGCSPSESAGVVTFSGCSIDTAGGSYKLHATDAALTAVDSSAFAVFAISALGTASTLTGGLATSFNTANTYTATTGSVVLVIVSAHVAKHAPTLSVSGGPTTGSFTKLPSTAVITKQSGNDGSVVQAFWALGTASTAAFTVTANAAISDAVVEVVQILGANTSAPIVGTPVTLTGTLSPASVTFAAPGAGDAQIVVAGMTQSSATMVTPPGGFTELQDGSSTAATNGQSLESSYTVNAVSGSKTAALSQGANWGAIGIEIAGG